MKTSYHCHSVLSDGENSIVEMVNSAIEHKIDVFGISDHYVLRPDHNDVWWSLKLDGLDDYVNAVLAIKEKYKDKIDIKLGLEADYFSETVDELKEIISKYNFDYVIGSIHFLDGFNVDESKENWDNLSEDKRNECMKDYWGKVADMANSKAFDFAGHLDLYKKFGYHPTVDLTKEMQNAFNAIADVKLPIELNTSGWYKECLEQYPSMYVLKECFNRDIDIVVTADAHNIKHVDRDYDRAFKMLSDIGYTEVCTWNNREMMKIKF
ncbi:MAG: histidinol-phosphatase [Armatimonadota bacterium]